MIRFLFLIPLLLCFVWFVYLRWHGYTFEQGKKGYFYIVALSVIIAAFYSALIWLTHL